MKIYCSSIILVIFASVVVSQQAQQYTIISVPAYEHQHACVQYCIGGEADENLPNALGCPSTYLNACVCRTDLQPSASSFLTACVNQGCSSDPSDLSSAISLYDSYCASNGFPVPNTTAGTSFVTNPTAPWPTATAATYSSASLTISSRELLLTFILSTILVHHLL